MADFDPDAFLASTTDAQAPQPTPQQTQPQPDSGFDPDAFLQSAQQEQYSTPGQMLKTAAEGAAQGVLGPLAPYAEKKLLGVQDEDINARREANPWIHGGAEAAGLVGGALTGTGEGALLDLAGRGAVEGLGLKGLEAGAGYGARVGSEAVKQAAEMAVLQGSDETAKMITNDPNTSAESAIANIGLAAAMGGAGGALGAGVVSPLWKATAGPKVEEFLSGLASKVNGEGKVTLPKTIQDAFDTLGYEPHPALKAALSGDPEALTKAQELYRAQHPEFMQMWKTVPEQLKETVAQGLGVPLDEVMHFSNAEAGKEVYDKAINQIADEYEPIQERLDARDAEAKTIQVPDERRIELGNRLMETAVGEDGPGTNSPQYKHFEKAAQDVFASDTIRGLDKITSDLGTQLRDHNEKALDKQAYSRISQIINDFKEQEISKQAKQIGESMVDSSVLDAAAKAKQAAKDAANAQEGSAGRGRTRRTAATAERTGAEASQAVAAGRAEGKQLGAGVLNQRADTNRMYAEYAQKMRDLTDHLGIKEFRGTGTLRQQLSKLTPEQLIKKFSTKGDVNSAAWLRETFPEIADLVQNHEAKTFLAPSVHEHMGQPQVDFKSLNRRLETLRKGNPEFADYVLKPGAADKIQAAKVINDAMGQISGIKDSGTPGGMGKVFRHFGASAIGAIGFLMGHNPVGSAVLGEMAQRLGKDLPEGIKFATLKYMGSDAPISGAGFKAAVNFVNDTYKGQNLLAKASKAVLKSGSQVLTDRMMPSEADRSKLDKIVSNYQNKPDSLADTKSDLGHYMPDHQTALSQAQTTQIQYLKSIKPMSYKLGPLDRSIPPSPAQTARYNRALDIAQQPAMVLHHIQQGSLQSTDIQDLQAMYPSYMASMQQKVTAELTGVAADDSIIPWHVRQGISMLLGQPIDSTMTPSSIQAAQASSQLQSGNQPQPQKPGKLTAKAGTELKKSADSFKTASQAAESDRSGRS